MKEVKIEYPQEPQGRIAVFLKEFPLLRNKTGQMLVLFAITWPIFLMGMISIFNIGTLVGERIRIQQIADDAAYSGAVWEARCLNYTAYCNRAIVAQLSFLAYLTAAQSHLDAWATIIGYLQYLPYVGSIAAAISNVLSEIKNMVQSIKDSGFWDIAMYSNSLAEFLMMGYIQMKMHSAMQEVATDADPSVTLDLAWINWVNHLSIVKLGEKEDLQYVTKETLSPWTKGQDEGQIPIGDRTYLALPRWMELPIFYVPVNVGIRGSITVDNNGFSSKDMSFYVWRVWIKNWTDLVTFHWVPRRQEVNLEEFSASRSIQWDNIKFFTFQTGRNNSVGIYASAKKGYSQMNPMLHKHFFRSGLFGMNDYNLFTVPNQDMKALAKAAARYEDPEPDSSRHHTLTDEKKEANLFNPFWHAELVALKPNDEEDANSWASYLAMWLFDPYRH
jgi:hypothetical protein